MSQPLQYGFEHTTLLGSYIPADLIVDQDILCLRACREIGPRRDIYADRPRHNFFAAIWPVIFRDPIARQCQNAITGIVCNRSGAVRIAEVPGTKDPGIRKVYLVENSWKPCNPNRISRMLHRKAEVVHPNDAPILSETSGQRTKRCVEASPWLCPTDGPIRVSGPPMQMRGIRLPHSRARPSCRNHCKRVEPKVPSTL